MPRHFIQTADLAGVGVPAIRAIFEDIAATAMLQAEAAIAAPPGGFPNELVTSLTAAIRRTRLVPD